MRDCCDDGRKEKRTIAELNTTKHDHTEQSSENNTTRVITKVFQV